MDRRLKVLMIGMTVATAVLASAWWWRRARSGEHASGGRHISPPSGIPGTSPDSAPTPAPIQFPGTYDPVSERPGVLIPPTTQPWADLALGYGKALREEGLRGAGVEAWRKRVLAYLNMCDGEGDSFEALLCAERDLLVVYFFHGFGLPLSADQIDRMMKLIAEERQSLNRIRKNPPDVPWVERARFFTEQACEWDRRLESILNGEQLAALRAHEGGIFDYRDVVLVRSDPSTNCERVNFRQDPSGERLSRKWASDIFGQAQDDPRLRTYATEYARLMLEIGVPDYGKEGRTSLSYRLRQLEIHASVQKMMLEDRRFTEDEMAKIRAWDELYEGDR
ncbi:MAG: hypothetical protein HYY18_02410 [Planctomycetes bacterium]|nr:hypothetical protein [Planctomycetota bacterium]